MVRIGSVVMNVPDVPENGEGPRLHSDQDDQMHLDLWAANAEQQRAEVDQR